ncbi:MAG TPA: bifunctional 5,10-methylene-tetrahydrofolate dehydrogenase/5,10-methylene-tetrahydrofolate cyclohydrolase, partial [Candidatus Komeilibacteria bacterium]|nr:bifunctional 5,10-methylene-tetrahydrofolate dehydrogenase/5,10-methylene-tetrahydrofolate cyclohydrolase [Candidatus Komeilibacteria bacterium]
MTLVTCGRSTPDLSHYTKTADIVITGVGKKDLLIGEMIKTGAVVIDAGVSFVGDQMYGDIDFASV